MRLKKIQWEVKEGNPKNNKKKFVIRGTFAYVAMDVNSFLITNEIPYTYHRCVYLKQSIPYRYGRRTLILKFKTIQEAKERAQKICENKFIKGFFIKDRKITRKTLIEKSKICI